MFGRVGAGLYWTVRSIISLEATRLADSLSAERFTPRFEPSRNSMKNIRALMFVFCLVQSSYGTEPELESVFLSRFFTNVTLTPGRITLTTGARVNFFKEGQPTRLLERGETITLTPGFSEVFFAERHSWFAMKRIGSGDLYELTSAFDARSFGKELEEKKYHLIFSPDKLEFRGAVPTAGGEESQARWGIVAVFIVIALGMSWFLVRRRK